MSVIVMAIVFLFSMQKLQHLLMRQNPSINTYMELEAFTAEDKLNLQQENIRIAFTLEDYFTREPKMDPKYVKWFAYYYTSEGGRTRRWELPIYKCTKEDYALFEPVD